MPKRIHILFSTILISHLFMYMQHAQTVTKPYLIGIGSEAGSDAFLF